MFEQCATDKKKTFFFFPEASICFQLAFAPAFVIVAAHPQKSIGLLVKYDCETISIYISWQYLL